MTFIQDKIKDLPDSPGVYLFLGSPKSSILYIGKATSLRDRVRSYFSKDLFSSRGPIIQKMMSELRDVEYIQTDSVLEALILEANLIKKNQPKYNTKEKDNKSFNYIVVTKEDFPRLLVVRGRELGAINKIADLQEKNKELPAKTPKTQLKNEQIGHIFGPFPQGGQLKEALKIIRKIFTFRDKCTPLVDLSRGSAEVYNFPVRSRACFNRQIGLCPGVCTGEISKKEYKKLVDNILLFLSGKKKTLIRKLEKQMGEYSKNHEFEKAGDIKKMIFTLNHIQDISLLKQEGDKGLSSGEESRGSVRIEAYDVSHLSGNYVVGAMVVVEDGQIKKSDYRKFKIKLDPGVDDTGAIKEMLRRRFFHHEWPKPDIVVVDGGVAQKRAASSVVKEVEVPTVEVVSVVKDDRHKPKDILGDQEVVNRYQRLILLANHESHRFVLAYHKQLRGKFPD